MPNSTECTDSAPSAQIAQNKKCPGCGVEFPAGGRGLGRVFCTNECRTGFQNRMKAEGGPLAALVKAWNLTRHAKPDTREAEICRYARSQISQISAHFSDRDADMERPSAVDYVGTLMDSGFNYFDRHR